MRPPFASRITTAGRDAAVGGAPAGGPGGSPTSPAGAEITQHFTRCAAAGCIPAPENLLPAPTRNSRAVVGSIRRRSPPVSARHLPSVQVHTRRPHASTDTARHRHLTAAQKPLTAHPRLGGPPNEISQAFLANVTYTIGIRRSNYASNARYPCHNNVVLPTYHRPHWTLSRSKHEFGEGKWRHNRKFFEGRAHTQ